mgnify:FL=1
MSHINVYNLLLNMITIIAMRRMAMTTTITTTTTMMMLVMGRMIVRLT